MHYEQRWLDLVPGLFEGVHILRDPGFNVAHWNLPERAIRMVDNELTAEGELCRFFRFSGFDADQPLAVTRYSTRLALADIPGAAPLFDRYLKLLEEAGYHETKTWSYAYDYFDNGVPIPDLARELYRNLGEEVRHFGDPFETAGSASFFQWLREAEPGSNGTAAGLSNLWRTIYELRLDLQNAFPDPGGADRERFLNWMRSSGAQEHGIAPEFLGT
jgi:hypothetical protein